MPLVVVAVANYEHVVVVRLGPAYCSSCMPQDGWTFFTWPVKRGERLRQLLNTEIERDGGKRCASEQAKEEVEAVSAMGYASFFTAIGCGSGGVGRVARRELGLVAPICAS